MSEITQRDAATDIPDRSWIDRFAPVSSRPYLRLARLDRPIGTWLLLLPCWWSVSLAMADWPDPWLFLLFGVGAVVMRGAGCTLNDIADRDFDRKVARTATRPIASGSVKVQQGWLFFGFQLFLGLMVLVQFNAPTVYLGFASLVLVATYPFMKRITYWPQAVLGLAFNWGALMGWSAVHGELAWPAIVLYAGGIFWTLGYDTIYAHQDKEDDVIVGVKSTALKFGERSKIWLSGFYTVTLVLIAVAGYLVDLAWPFYLVLSLGGLHLSWQIHTLDIDDPKNCLRRFKSNRDFGLVVLAAIVVGNLFA